MGTGVVSEQAGELHLGGGRWRWARLPVPGEGLQRSRGLRLEQLVALVREIGASRSRRSRAARAARRDRSRDVIGPARTPLRTAAPRAPNDLYTQGVRIMFTRSKHIG